MLSAVICTHNEVLNLPRAVSSVQGLADEIIVVDSRSSDGTAALAKKLGCRVYTHPYTGIVEPVRNFAIAKAKGDWILILDADEEVPAGLAKFLHQELQKPQADFYRLPRKNIIFGAWIKSDHWWPDYVYRFFRRGFVTWDSAIHSIPYTRGVGIDLPPDPDLALIHQNYQTVSQYLDRLNRYTDHQLTQLTAAGYAFSPWDLLTRPSREFYLQYFARSGWRDGIHGLSLSLLQAVSELVLYLKVWQQRNFTPGQLPLSAWPAQLKPLGREFRWWWYQSLITSSSWPKSWWWRIRRKLHLNSPL